MSELWERWGAERKDEKKKKQFMVLNIRICYAAKKEEEKNRIKYIIF